MTPARPDIFGEATYDDADPPGFRGGEVLSGGAKLSHAAGGSELNVRAFVLPAGEALCPYHYEYVEEWLLLLDGELDLRTPDGTERLTTGALACFPTGPEGAHRVATPAGSGRPARFVMFSSAAEPAVCVYADTGKVGVFVPGGADNMLVRPADGRAEYYDGETGG